MTTTLNLFIDLGSSLIKVLYYHNDQPHIFLMSPQVASISGKRLNALVDANPTALAEDLAWVEMDGELLAVGNLAEQLNGLASIKPRKAEQGVLRVLGVLGILAENLSLPQHFECNLGVALPVAEYADRESFAEQLKIAGKTFNFRGKTLSIAFNRLDVEIEGMGLVRDRRAELLSQSKSANKIKIVALMLGHRNLSVLTFSGSTLQLESSSSSGPGFVKAVEVAARALAVEPTTPGLTEIVALNKTSYRFEGSLKRRDTTAAVAEARAEYWRMVSEHLQQAMPGGEFEVIAAGGALPVIQEDLIQFFTEFGLEDRLSFAEKLQKNLVKALATDKPDGVLTVRLLDAFVGLQTLLLKVKQAQSAPAPAAKTKSKAAAVPVDSVVSKFSVIL